MSDRFYRPQIQQNGLLHLNLVYLKPIFAKSAIQEVVAPVYVTVRPIYLPQALQSELLVVGTSNTLQACLVATVITKLVMAIIAWSWI